MKVIQQGRIPEYLMAHGKSLETYRLSSFCIVRQIEDGYLLCNGATGSLIILSGTEYSDIEQGKELSPQLSDFLASNLFIVDRGRDEYKLVDEERNSADREDGSICSFTILPTSRCNARCFYCYENGIKHQNMSGKQRPMS